MSTMQDFETALNEVVSAKRLSQSKITKLTEIAMKLMSLDTQLVSAMYRTHKSLPASSKISSLYVFDALSRAARQQVVKNNLSDRQTTGNCATFLLKIAGVLDGLFQDMLRTGLPEAKEKTKKIYDIWVKGGTFPPSILSRLSDIVSGKDKGAYRSFFSVERIQLNQSPVCLMSESGINGSSTSASDPRITTQVNSVSSAKSSTAATSEPQETLLALLAQAAGQQTQTNTNTVASPASSNPTHLLLQYLQSASVNSTAASQISPTTSAPVSDPAVSQSATNPRIPNSFTASRAETVSGRHSPTHDRYRSLPRDDHYHEKGYDGRAYPGSDQRGNHHWHGRRNRWEERGQNYKRPSKDVAWSPRSRSRSPDGRTRRKSSPFSSPRQPFSRIRYSGDSPTSQTVAGKDEFGRDLRSPSPSKSPSAPPQTINASPITPTTPHDLRAEFSSTSTNNDSMSRSSPIAANANTLSKDPDASEMSVVESNTSSSSQSGSNNFDVSSFDPTSPASWEALGKMWETINGYTPSAEELMQFLMMGAASQSVSNKDWQQQNATGFDRARGYGDGYGRDAPRGGRGYGDSYGNSRNNHHERTGGGEEANWQSTDAVVLGGGSPCSDVTKAENLSELSQPPAGSEGRGGKMQKVGDRWVFVRSESTTS